MLDLTRVREETIEIIISNLVQAEVIKPGNEEKFISALNDCSSTSLIMRLIESRYLLDRRLATTAKEGKN